MLFFFFFFYTFSLIYFIKNVIKTKINTDLNPTFQLQLLIHVQYLSYSTHFQVDKREQLSHGTLELSQLNRCYPSIDTTLLVIKFFTNL